MRHFGAAAIIVLILTGPVFGGQTQITSGVIQGTLVLTALGVHALRNRNKRQASQTAWKKTPGMQTEKALDA